MKYVIGIGLTLSLLFACSGTVDVEGVPESIRLDVPFCVPPSPAKDAGPIKDAGTDG